MVENFRVPENFEEGKKIRLKNILQPETVGRKILDKKLAEEKIQKEQMIPPEKFFVENSIQTMPVRQEFPQKILKQKIPSKKLW